MCNPTLTEACTVYFKSPAYPAGFSGKVPTVQPCRMAGRAADTCHLLSMQFMQTALITSQMPPIWV